MWKGDSQVENASIYKQILRDFARVMVLHCRKAAENHFGMFQTGLSKCCLRSSSQFPTLESQEREAMVAVGEVAVGEVAVLPLNGVLLRGQLCALWSLSISRSGDPRTWEHVSDEDFIII